jgi:glycosyltransferase involved in cell wall biosynthesis
MSDQVPAHALWVVVPFFNEARGIEATLAALAAQHDPAFTLVLVDNASTDGGAAVAERFLRARPAMRWEMIHEPQKGTGAAADTGVRHAIARGAQWVARTDADCLPDARWTRVIRHAFTGQQLQFVAGRIRPRLDEGPVSRTGRAILAAMIWLAEHYGRLHRRGPQFRYPYFMAAGNNLAIGAGLYLRSGGFPRTAIEHEHEDRVLSEKVRTLTTRAAVRDDMVVLNSVRRVHRYGYLNTLRWYRNHGYRPLVVDVR